jgi:hypothetical protein
VYNLLFSSAIVLKEIEFPGKFLKTKSCVRNNNQERTDAFV